MFSLLTSPWLSRAEFNAHPAQLEVTDKIAVRNLQATVDAGVDVWGREKKQRVLVTVTLSLAKPFNTAAESDALDSSTVHYGKLSKDIQAAVDRIQSHHSTHGLVETIYDAVVTYTLCQDETILTSLEVDVFYPKGSMFGEGAGYAFGQILHDGKQTYQQLYLRDVRVPCLIGVNANERRQKQPVVVNFWIDGVEAHQIDNYPAIETAIVEAISHSSFETLESLSTAIVKSLEDNFFTIYDDCSSVRLRIEKPHAVPAADAPAIEIVRRVRAKRRSRTE